MAGATTRQKANRTRSSSVTEALKQVPLNRQASGDDSRSTTPTTDEVKPLDGPRKPRSKRNKDAEEHIPEFYHSRGFWDDLATGRWMLVPSSAFILLMVPIVLYLAIYISKFVILKSHGPLAAEELGNPFAWLLFPQYRLPNGLYTKGWKDVLFVANYIVFWTFVRQFVTLHILRPMARRLGVKAPKVMRFMEQGYAVFYFSIMGTLGMYVMMGLPPGWYDTKYYWLNYPHRQMTVELKSYYLLQFAYWLQQTIILVARIEKPRKDFKELVAHHMVTLYLVGWSYVLHFTYIGTAVFVTMDVSDIFLSLSKCVNYFNEPASHPIFAMLVVVWTYFRHYLNIRLLWSVLFEFDLIPVEERTHFRPFSEDRWVAPWLRWQIFLPMFLLQCINLFWWFLIMRILVKAIVGVPPKDDRSDDEDEGEEKPTQDKVKAE